MKIKNKIILCVCSFILMICTMFSFAPITKSDDLVVKADTIIESSTFTSSNILVPIANTPWAYSNGVGTSTSPGGWNSYNTSSNFSFLFSYFSFRLRNNPDTGILEIAPNFKNIEIFNDSMLPSVTGTIIPQELLYVNCFTNSGTADSSYTYTYTDEYLPLLTYAEPFNDSNVPTVNLLVTSYVGAYVGSGYITDNISSGTLYGIRMNIMYSSMNFNISKLSYVELSMNNVNYETNWSRYYLKYVDSNNNFIRFTIWCGRYNFDYETKTYYFNNPSLNDSESYNQGYQAGQQSGYNNGFEVGRSEGYNAGYNVGQDIGYNNGFSDGVEDSNQYTFLNLISATIDAPITYFQQLFNFELLGVNLQGFLTGLFTLCVIVTIIKLCLGG